MTNLENTKVEKLVTEVVNIKKLHETFKNKLNEDELESFYMYTNKKFFESESNFLVIYRNITQYYSANEIASKKTMKIMQDYLINVLNESVDLDNEKIKSVVYHTLEKFSQNIYRFSNISDELNSEMPFLKNKEVVKEFLTSVYHLHFLDKVKADREGLLVESCDNFKIINKTLNLFFENSTLAYADKRDFLIILMNKMIDISFYIGERILNSEFKEFFPSLSKNLSEVLNNHLTYEDRFDFEGFNNILMYKKSEGKQNRYNIFIDKEKMSLYFGVNEATWDRRFWLDVAGDTFGFGTAYFDNNKFVRHDVDTDGESIDINFSKNLDDDKQKIYIELIKENLKNMMSSYIREEITEPYNIMKKTENTTLKMNITQKIVMDIQSSIRQITLSEELVDKKVPERKKNKI